MVNFETFLNNFKNAISIEGIELGELTPDTAFRELEVWDSMNALNTLAMIDFEYGIQLPADELQACQTILDIFEKVSARVNAK